MNSLDENNFRCKIFNASVHKELDLQTGISLHDVVEKIRALFEIESCVVGLRDEDENILYPLSLLCKAPSKFCDRKEYHIIIDETCCEIDTCVSFSDMRRLTDLSYVPVREAFNFFASVTNSEGHISEIDFIACFDALRQRYAENIENCPANSMKYKKVLKRLFNAMREEPSDKVVSFDMLMGGLAVICGGTTESRLLAAFEVYDFSSKGFIRLDSLHLLLTSMFQVLYEINEGFKEKMYNLLPSQIGRILAQEAFRKLSVPSAGSITFNQFMNWYIDAGISEAGYESCIMALKKKYPEIFATLPTMDDFLAKLPSQGLKLREDLELGKCHILEIFKEIIDRTRPDGLILSRDVVVFFSLLFCDRHCEINSIHEIICMYSVTPELVSTTELLCGLGVLLGGELDLRILASFRVLDMKNTGTISLHSVHTYIRSVRKILGWNDVLSQMGATFESKIEATNEMIVLEEFAALFHFVLFMGGLEESSAQCEKLKCTYSIKDVDWSNWGCKDSTDKILKNSSHQELSHIDVPNSLQGSSNTENQSVAGSRASTLLDSPPREFVREEARCYYMGLFRLLYRMQPTICEEIGFGPDALAEAALNFVCDSNNVQLKNHITRIMEPQGLQVGWPLHSTRGFKFKNDIEKDSLALACSSFCKMFIDMNESNFELLKAKKDLCLDLLEPNQISNALVMVANAENRCLVREDYKNVMSSLIENIWKSQSDQHQKAIDVALKIFDGLVDGGSKTVEFQHIMVALVALTGASVEAKLKLAFTAYGVLDSGMSMIDVIQLMASVYGVLFTLTDLNTCNKNAFETAKLTAMQLYEDLNADHTQLISCDDFEAFIFANSY